ncbi:hypothetical protein KNE206_22690 [Kitasatospora sp. NE20-6]|uniref:hypothetical protein n=1 Tax=Kitasatospora sp. NE20-6 TaxID=2859066 RepID=UPI0034DB96D7
MAICTGCGAASAGWARSCANCGRSFDRADQPGEPVSAGLIGVVEAEAGSGAASAAGRWGRGVPYEPRGGGPAAFGRALAPWAPAARALLAPTALLLAAAALLAQSESVGFPAGDYGSRFRVCLARVLAAFGAATETRSAGDSDGMLMLNSQVTSAAVLLLTALWTALLWLGLRAAGRRRSTPADARAAVEEAGRTGVLAGVVVLLLALAGRVRLPVFPDFPRRGSYLVEPGLWPTVPVVVLLAGATALAVHGRVADLPRVAPWWAAARAAAGAAGTSVVFAGAAVVVLAVAQGDGVAMWVVVPLAVNGGLFLLAFGSGAQMRVERWGAGEERGAEGFSLLHPGAVPWAWWTVLAAVAAALVLAGWVHRLRLGRGARLRAAVLHALLLSALMAVAGGSERHSYGFEPTLQGQAWSLGVAGVLVANAVWSAVGALALPVVFARVRPARVLIGAPPADGPEPSAEPEAAPEPPAVPYASEVMDWRTRD